jgi:F-type H+-transporting ATPase subunit delta
MDKTSAIYATAVFELAVAQNRENQWRDQIESLDKAWRISPEILAFFARTQIGKAEKKEVLRQSLDKIDPLLVNTLCLLVDKDRMAHFPDIAKDFRHLYNEKHKIIEGTVFSVRPLDNKEIETLNHEFSLRNKQQVRFENRIDPTLISGIKILFDDKIMDGSMKARIGSLRTELIKGNR